MDPQRSFYHTSYLCGELFGLTDRYHLFRERILPTLLSLRAKLDSLYCGNNGRPAVDPVLLAGVTLLQFMEKAPDRVAAERVRYHLGWKYALDLELSDGGFHPTVLVYFRDRLVQNKTERVIFDGVLALLIELGLVKRKSKQRIDSTHILGYVKEMSRLECVLETVRLALQAIAPRVLSAGRPEFWEQQWALYVQSEVDWRLDKAQRDSRYCQCGQDIKDLLEWIDKNHPNLSELEAMKVLRRVFVEQFEVVDGKIAPRAKRPPHAVQNPHDPDAHYADKGKRQWVGYKVHVVETVEPTEPAKVKGEPAENFITEILTTEAAQDERAGLAEALKREQQHHEIKPQAMYADAGYVTEKTLTEAEQEAMELLGPTRPDSHKGPYNVDAFHVDIEKRQAVCPQGNLSTQCSHIQDACLGIQYYRIEWARQCDSCPVQRQCTRSKSGRRILVVGLRHDLLEKRRKEMREAEFSKKMYPRNGIEATHSELVRGHGLRRTKYRGKSRVGLSHYLMAAACNVKRYLNRMAFEIARASPQPT